MSPIGPQLEAALEGFKARAPEEAKIPIFQALADLQASFDLKGVPQVGSTLPNFSLSNATGQTVSLKDLLAKEGTKGVFITFYRGSWCPFCNIALHGLQEHQEEFAKAGVTLVAITPELPDGTLSTTEKHDLKFEVLSDVDTKYAQELGIMWQMPDSVRFVFAKFDFKTLYGNDSQKVVVPTNILVDKQGKVRNLFTEPDYTKRLEPATAVQWAQAL